LRAPTITTAPVSLLLLLCACESVLGLDDLTSLGPDVASTDDGGTEQGADATSAAATDGGSDGAAEGGHDEGASTDGSSLDDGGCALLELENYQSRCAVSIAGDAFSTSARQAPCVAPGTVDLAAMPGYPFAMLGPGLWHHTSGDHGLGDRGVVTGVGAMAQSTTTVVVPDAGACVWVCCPLITGSGDCPPVDQCLSQH
jgi:hypothetical protein